MIQLIIVADHSLFRTGRVNPHKPNVIAGLTRNPQCVIIIALMLLTAWSLLSCNNNAANPNPNRVQNPVRVETTIDAAADTVFDPTGNAVLDSLLRLTAIAKQDTNLARIYFQIGKLYENNDHKKAKEYYLKCYHLSEQFDWNHGRWLFADIFPIMLAREGLIDSALIINAQGLALAKKENHELWIADLNIGSGQIFVAKEWLETASHHYMEALQILERLQIPERLGNLYLKMMQLYMNLYLHEKAIEYGEKAVILLEKYPSHSVFALYGIGLAYSQQKGQSEKAKEYFLKASEIAIQQNNIYLLEAIYLGLAEEASNMYDLDEATMYVNKTLKLRGSEENILNVAGYHNRLGKIELSKGNYSKAEKHFLHALEWAINIEVLHIQKNCYLYLIESSAAQHKFRDNIRYTEALNDVETAMAKETAIRSSAEMAAKYETEKKELLIGQQQQVIRSQNLQRGLLAGGVAVAVVILFMLWMMLRLRNRRNLALTERNVALTERTDTLAEMNATKDKFFNIISHDLKNPVILLHDSLKLLAENGSSWNVDQLSAYYNELLKSSDGLSELIYNLLSWSQIQAGRISYMPAPFLLSDLLPGLSLIRSMASAKRIDFVACIPANTVVTADIHIISTVVRNLLTNAVKFTPAGGTVTLEIVKAPSNSPKGGESPLSFGEGAGVRLISVSDTGVGMTGEQISNLFRIDRQHSLKGTAGEQGTGLGLIVCKELLDKHNSILHVESEVGKGSRFWFTV